MPEKRDFILSKDPTIVKAIEDQRVFRANGLSASPEGNGREPQLIVKVPVNVGGASAVKGVIPLSEASADGESKNMNFLVGTEVPFVIKGVDEEKGILICSRKMAQEKNKRDMLNEFAKGTAFEGRITGFLSYGAFVEVNGVSGILRNVDYASDHSRIVSRYKLGDKISVKCKAVSSDDRARITWEAVTKYHRTTPVECDIEVGAVARGEVIDIHTFENSGQAVFVRLDMNDELDVLCSMPADKELERGVAVIVRILRIDPPAAEFDPPRIRGLIIGYPQA